MTVGHRGAVSCLSCQGDDDALGGRLVRLVPSGLAGEVPNTSHRKPSDLQGSPAFHIPSSSLQPTNPVPAPSPSKPSKPQKPSNPTHRQKPQVTGDLIPQNQPPPPRPEPLAPAPATSPGPLSSRLTRPTPLHDLWRSPADRASQRESRRKFGLAASRTASDGVCVSRGTAGIVQ